METKLFNQEGKEIGVIELDQNIFGLDVNNGLIHRALVYQLANARKNIAHTKTRSDVRGSTRKIYKQKHTGNARAGSSRSPVRRKGGVVFGPRNNRNFTLEMNKKERRKALFCALSSKVINNEILIVDDIKLDAIKTKTMVSIFSKLPYEKNVLLVSPVKNEVLYKSSANLPYVKTILADYLNIADLLKYKTLVLLKESLEKINALK
ncbi:MAG: 50S ribosomal protein L4 [Candidatus Gracilibacteria bacterium]|nr:50S ribosomal protein L4 [Candidatus Gracilibacteria bacterium]